GPRGGSKENLDTDAMSKIIKQMQMTALKGVFGDVRDLVVLSMKGVTSEAEYGLRAAMRKKKIRLHGVKNSLCRRVFDEMGLKIPADSPFWTGPTVIAFGASSLGELSREIDTEISNPKKKALYADKVTVKGAVEDGQPLAFEQAKKRPTRQEAI